MLPTNSKSILPDVEISSAKPKKEEFVIMQLLDTQTPLLNTQGVTLHVTREQFDALCHDNPELRLELTATGELIIMPPASWESSAKNGDLFGEVWTWNRQTRLGRVLDSSGGYTLSGEYVLPGFSLDVRSIFS